MIAKLSNKSSHGLSSIHCNSLAHRVNVVVLQVVEVRRTSMNLLSLLVIIALFFFIDFKGHFRVAQVYEDIRKS
jgi:hypothetical protein